jgi:transcriptional regulator with XRE-family HTH domain
VDSQEIDVNLSDSNTPSMEVGQRLRELREQRRISMRQLGRLSGISVNALSQIERGQTSPSVSTLYRLVDALGVPITAIFRAEPQQEEIVFRSATQRTKVQFPKGVWEGLGGEAFVGRVQPFMLTLESGADSGMQAIVHTGHEFVMCLHGSLEYTVESKKFLLGSGDSLLFAARLRHSWWNPGNIVTNAIIVLSGFENYENPGGFHLATRE